MNGFFNGVEGIQLLILIISAVLIGINKTGMPGIGVLPVIMLSIFFPAKYSTGLQLIMLCMADCMAMMYYRKRGNMKLVLKLLPCALIGLGLGSLTLRFLGDNDGIFKIIIAVIILSLSALNYYRQHYLKVEALPKSFLFAAIVGVLAGFTTQIANAAGPVMAIYLLALRLPKDEYMGTSVWYFFILNFIKLPIFILEGRITYQAFRTDLSMLPFIFLGAFLGIVFIRKAPQKLFNYVIEILVVISGTKLLYDGIALIA